MFNDDVSDGLDNIISPYQFLNQAAVTNAMESGQTIDWAQLAQQWIQMRDNTTATSTEDVNFSINYADNVSGQRSFKLEEKGEADMDMDDEEHVEGADIGRVEKNSFFTVMQHHPANRARLADGSFLSNTDENTEANSKRVNQWSTQTMLRTNCNVSTINRPINPTAHIPSLLSMNVPHPNDIRTMQDNSIGQNSQQSVMDAAKRKALPAWIREGLEKMEREKQRKQEKNITENQSDDSERSRQEHVKNATVITLNIDQTDDEEEECAFETLVSSICAKPPITAVSDSIDSGVCKSYEQKLSELMVVVRRTLTELLLEVTNQEISKIANDSIKVYKLRASSAQVIQNSALSSITSKLGLAAYDDGSSDECSDGDDFENSPIRKTLPSEVANESEEEIKNTIRSKRREFLKIADEIEERVAVAAIREEEKLKYYSDRNELNASHHKTKSMERNTKQHQREADSKDTTQVVPSCSGKLFDRDTGETTETMLQAVNGKIQKERGARKERTTRFSDNKDKKYLALAASVSYVRDLQTKDQVNTATISSQSLSSLRQTSCKLTVMPSSAGANTEAGVEPYVKRKISISPENSIERIRDKKQTCLKKTQERRSSGDSSTDCQTSSSTSSSSSSSSDLDSSSSNSSNNSTYSNRSYKKHSSYVSNTDKSKSSAHTQKDKYDNQKYHSSNIERNRESYQSRYRSDRSRSRSRSRSHHRQRRRGSHDSDKDYRRRKYDSRYSSSHSRSRNSNYHRHRDYSNKSSSRSYTSSNRRH